MKRTATKDEYPALAAESDIVVSVYLVGHGLEHTQKKEGANVTYLNAKGEVLYYAKYISDVYGYEIRSATRKTGYCRAMLHSSTIETKRHEPPIVPAAAVYMARAREAFERIQ